MQQYWRICSFPYFLESYQFHWYMSDWSPRSEIIILQTWFPPNREQSTLGDRGLRIIPKKVLKPIIVH